MADFTSRDLAYALSLHRGGDAEPARQGPGRVLRRKAAVRAERAMVVSEDPAGAAALTLPYPPGKNHLYATVRGRRVLSREGREYKAEVGRVVSAAGLAVVPAGVPVAVWVDVYRPRRSGDLDGRLVCLFDALTGVAWADDSQVVFIRARRFEDPDRPRAEVLVKAGVPAGPAKGA